MSARRAPRTTTRWPRLTRFGEGALLVEWAATPARAPNARVHAFANALRQADLEGVVALVPGAVSLLVELDPLADVEGAEERVHTLLARAAPRQPVAAGRLREVPVVYGGGWGPDLEEVAAQVGLSPAEVVRRHSSAELVVYMLGFAPGFPYLGDLPAALALPRRPTPRERVPAGSVAIAGRQTGIYPRASPGGWHLIGRTPLVLFDARRDPPAYLAPGDRVRFRPVAPTAWDTLAGPAGDW